MENQKQNSSSDPLLGLVKKYVLILSTLAASILISSVIFIFRIQNFNSNNSVAISETDTTKNNKESDSFWKPAEIEKIEDYKLKEMLKYGKELIVHTARYFGPKGTISNFTNGMNCQNCHLEAGTAIFGNNYGSVASMYPKFRDRSGTKESIGKRVNDCFERSLNGHALDTSSRELQAIIAYIKYIGSNVEKGKKANGSGFKDLAYLNRAADPVNGKKIYGIKCQSCHQENGEGVLNTEKTEYTYPPLWGMNSYNDGAGLYRISNFAKYIKYNMPLGVNYKTPLLTDEEAWDLAAFVNSQNRPHKKVPTDWPDISKKPVDHPFGPYSDSYSEQQHKFGPFGPIADAKINKK